MPRMLNRRFQHTLALCGESGDAVRQQFTTVVQKTLEYADVAVINISNIPNLERIRLLFKRVTLILLLVLLTAASSLIPPAAAVLLSTRVAAVTLPWPSACRAWP